MRVEWCSDLTGTTKTVTGKWDDAIFCIGIAYKMGWFFCLEEEFKVSVNIPQN